MKYTNAPYQTGATVSVSYTGTAGVTAVVAGSVNVVRVVCTTDAFVSFGTAPTATTSDMFMEAKKPEYFVIPPGGTTKVSAVQSASGGTVYVTALT